MGRPQGAPIASSSVSEEWRPTLDVSSRGPMSAAAAAADEPSEKKAKWTDKRESHPASSDWKMMPTEPKTSPWKYCTLCYETNHVAADCPTTVMLQETASEMQAEAEVATADGTADFAAADPEVAGESTDPTGEPPGDSPVGPVDNPEDTGEFLEDTRRWTLSPSEGRHIPYPPDQHGVDPTGDENCARYRRSSMKGKNKGKQADHARYKSKFKGKDKGKSLLSLAGLGSQPPPSDFGKGKKGGTGKSKRSDRDEQWRSNERKIFTV